MAGWSDDDESPTRPILACGHLEDGTETPNEMMVVLRDEVDEPITGERLRAFSTGCWCKNCRALPDVANRMLRSKTEIEAWLRHGTL